MNKKASGKNIYYPIFLNIMGKRCVVIGGGKVALRKVKRLFECGADVTVISPRLHIDIIRLAAKRAIHLIQREYKLEDLKKAAIVMACTDDKDLNRKVADQAKKRKLLVNVADDPESSDFIIPSSFRRGKLTVAVSTSGVSPALSRKIRTNLQKSFGEEYASLLPLVGEVRSALKEKGYRVSPETWQQALDLDLLIQLVRSGQQKKAKTVLLKRLIPRQAKSSV